MLLLPNCRSSCQQGVKTPGNGMVSSAFCQTSGLISHKPRAADVTYSQSSNLHFGVGMICALPQSLRGIAVSGCSRKSRMLCHASFSVPENAAVVVVHNFYEVLGLRQDVALADIKAAYRRMARRYHPDVCAREEAQECTKRFIVLQEAYETLSDPWRRASYDRAMTNSLYSCSGWSMEEGDQLNWKLRWEDQLAVLKTRSAVNARENSDSWGARMRRRRQQQEQQ